MVQYVFTPWRDQKELLKVRSQLYPEFHPESSGIHLKDQETGEDETYMLTSNHLEQKREAVARVSMWMQRGNCPHLVESTALLEAAILSDHQATSEPSLASSSNAYAARAAYSAAFSRFVTGLLDSHQDKQRKMNMYAVAKSVGLPATFVELRHQATHEQLPSLVRLRVAAEKARQWIWGYYWKHLDAGTVVSDASQARKDIVATGSRNTCRQVLLEFLATEDEEEKAMLEAEVNKKRRSEVWLALGEIQTEVKEPKLLRGSLALMTKMMASDVPMDQRPMRPDEPPSNPRDIGAIRARLEEDKRELERVYEPVRCRVQDSQTTTAGSEGQAWSKQDRSSWVPKPIGLV